VKLVLHPPAQVNHKLNALASNGSTFRGPLTFPGFRNAQEHNTYDDREIACSLVGRTNISTGKLSDRDIPKSQSAVSNRGDRIMQPMPCNLQKAVIWFFLAVLACARSDVYAQPQYTIITKIKLADYGWEPIPKGDYREHRGSSSRKLWMDHEGRVLVGFTVREDFTLATREHPGRSFHLLRFTSDGKPGMSSVLPTNNWYNNGFYLGPDDQIVARANDTLQFFMPDESQHQDGTWQPLTPCGRDCFVGQSFSRRTAIVRSELVFKGPEQFTRTILDLSSSPPHVVRTCQMASGQITDRYAYRTSYDRDNDLTVRFPFCELEHYEELPAWGHGGMGYVFNDETLLKIDPSRLKLVGADGRVKFSLDMPKHDYINYFEIATDDAFDRFAFSAYTKRGEHPRLDIGGHVAARRVLVLDETGRTVASIPVDTQYHMDFDFAMSPDGRRLAILEEGVLTIAELP